jgi:hypothetical protein
MWLYKRFVDLYGSSKVPAQLPLSAQEVVSNGHLAGE